MSSKNSLGLEQARARLSALAERAHAGKTSIITRHGKPYAAIVPISALPPPTGRNSVLDLRGSGKRLWGRSSAKAIDRLRNEWD